MKVRTFSHAGLFFLSAEFYSVLNENFLDGTGIESNLLSDIRERHSRCVQAYNLFVKSGWQCVRLISRGVRRCSESFFDAPSAAKSIRDRVSVYAGYLRPFTNAMNFAVKFNLLCFACVPAVRLVVNPTHVHRPVIGSALVALAATVMAVVVNAVDGVLLSRPASHQVKEGRELGNAITEGNASADVPVGMGPNRIEASLANALPNGVFGKSVQSVAGLFHDHYCLLVNECSDVRQYTTGTVFIETTVRRDARYWPRGSWNLPLQSRGVFFVRLSELMDGAQLA